MPRGILDRPMFARGGVQGGLPGLKKGFSFSIKGEGTPVNELVKRYGIEAVAWLQRKIMGGSSIKQSWAEFLVKSRNVELDKSISKLNKEKEKIDIVGPRTERETDAITTQLDDINQQVKFIEEQKIDASKVSGHDWGDAIKWGNEGWVNPLGWVPKAWPTPFRPPRTKIDKFSGQIVPDETLGGALKEYVGKAGKIATVPIPAAMYGLPYAKEKAKEWWIGPEQFEKEKEKEKLSESGVAEGWADAGELTQKTFEELPQKTIENKVLENQILKKDVFGEQVVDHKEIKDVVADNLSDVTSSADVADIKSTTTGGTSDVNIPPEDGGGTDVVDMSKAREDYEKKKAEKGDGLPADDGEIDVSSQDELNILKDRAAFDGSMELDKNDLSDIQSYIGFLQKVMGDRDPMVGASLLMQLGTSLMNAETTRGGIEGFLQAAGQAGAQIAPQLMKLGQLNEQKKQALATAALQMYMDKMKELKPSGAPYMVAELKYGKNAAGETVPIGMKTMMPYQLNSPQMRNVFAENDQHFAATGFPKYDIIQPGDPRGTLVAAGWGAGADPGGLLTESGQVQRQEAGKYLHNVLDLSVPFWTGLIDNPELLGAMGEILSWGLGAKATAKAVIDLFNQELPGWETQMSEDFYRLRDLYKDINPPVDRDGNHTMEMGGQNISVFVDWNNDYRLNAGGMKLSAGEPRDLRNAGEHGYRIYMVDRKEGFDKYFDPVKMGKMDLVQRTIGTGYARSRQPTGRMLADILVGSLKDAAFTGIGTGVVSDEWAILGRHVHIMNEMYKKVGSSYELANIFLDEKKSNPAYKNVPDDSGHIIYKEGARFLPDYVESYIDSGGNKRNMWKIKSLKEFANKLYALKQAKPEKMKDIELDFYSFADWESDINMQLQNQVTQESSKQVNESQNFVEQYYDDLKSLIGQ